MLNNNKKINTDPTPNHSVKDVSIQIFSEIEMKNFTYEFKEKIIECYLDVWNDSLKEIYTYDEAMNNINGLLDLSYDKEYKFSKEIIIAFNGSQVIGFCGFELYQDLSSIAGALSSFSKHYAVLHKAFNICQFWVNDVLKKNDYCMLIKSISILKPYREGLLPLLASKIYPSKVENYPFTIAYVKSTLNSLNWALGCGLYPLYICPETKMVFLGGSSRKILETCQHYIDNINSPEKFSEINKNLKKIYY